MKIIQYKLPKNQKKNYSIIISKLISKCQNKDQLHKITCLIDDNDSYIKTASINAYVSVGNASVAEVLDIFNDTDDIYKDHVMTGAVMNILINRMEYKKAINIYNKHKLA